MSVSGSDIVEYPSTSAGSTGGVINTSSAIISGVTNNVNPNEDDTQRAAGGIVYRKTYWKNTHATDAAILPVVYASVLPTNMTLSIGLGVNHVSDDDPLQGNMTAWSAGARVALISDGADTRVVTVYGLVGSVPTMETITLTSTTEVLSVASFATVFGWSVPAISASRIITIKQGTGGTARGTIGLNKIASWLWIASPGTAKTAGLQLPNLAAAQNIAVWRKLAWTAGAAAVRPNSQTVKFEENA